MDVRLVHLREACILCVLTETLAAQIEAGFPGQTGGLSRGKNENPDRIFSAGSRKGSGDPSCSLKPRGERPDSTVCSALARVPRKALGCRSEGDIGIPSSLERTGNRHQ